MVRILKDQTFVQGKRYIEAAGLSTDEKPSSGVITGSRFLEVNTGFLYQYDEANSTWHKVKALSEDIATAVDAWLDDHPEATTTVEDGAITWAKLNTSLQENIDNTAEEVNLLKSALGNITGNPQIEVTEVGKYINLSGKTADINNPSTSTSGFCYSLVECSEGDKFTVSAVGGTGARAWGFIDSSGTVLSVAESSATATSLLLEAPTDSAYLIINDKGNKTSYYGELIKNVWDEMKHVPNDYLDGLVKLEKTKTGPNIIDKATLVAEHKYVGGVNSDTGKVSLYDSQTLNTYIVPVDGESVYTFTYCRTACVVADLSYTAVSEMLSYQNTIDSTGGKYILFSFNPSTYPLSTYSITFPQHIYRADYWEIAPDNRKAKLSNSGEIASGGGLNITGRTSIKDGELITFKGYIESFGNGFRLNFYGSDVTNYIEVTSSKISVKYSTADAVAVDHNLDLTNANVVVLTVRFEDGDANIKLYADGDVYSVSYGWIQTSGTVTEPRILSIGSVFSSATLMVTYSAATRRIWYFGDSYVSFLSESRWPYYLANDGYAKNALFSGSAGASSASSSVSFGALLNIGLPEIAVMATGINDGSDSDAPSALWATNRDAFIALCQSNGIEPIFCTIPTVPSVNNEQKNAWVKTSGYRYIDFAKAVGADGTGAWYSGMLSSDNVHPTELGAKALYTQVLIDLPEITIDA